VVRPLKVRPLKVRPLLVYLGGKASCSDCDAGT
jgi:hypothetical protein